MAERELGQIVAEACAHFDTLNVVAVHRIGRLDVGEASVVIAAAHPHRAQAYDASRYVIEQIKIRLPIWKREEYVDGTREWTGQTRESEIGNGESSPAFHHSHANLVAAADSRLPLPESR